MAWLQTLETPKTPENNGNVKEVKEGIKKIPNQDIRYMNNNPDLAQKRADEIIAWLPDSLNTLSRKEQDFVMNSINKSLTGINLNLAPKDAEHVPDILPQSWNFTVKDYVYAMNNISRFSPEQQKTIKKAGEEAIKQLTDQTKNDVNLEIEPQNTESIDWQKRAA